MPLQLPNLDNRRYQDLLDEALARIPVHNPEWTNFNKSDPGVTLLEIFAFLTETLLYRSNQIPERNRRKFLSLLGVPLQPASSARGIVAFSLEGTPPSTVTLNGGVEVYAGSVPFRTEQGLDVLPLVAEAFFKEKVGDATPQLRQYYAQLYASQLKQAPAQLYQTVPLAARAADGVDLGQETADNSLWIALLLRAGDRPLDKTDQAREQLKGQVRKALYGKTLSLGVVPCDPRREHPPGGQDAPEEPDLGRKLPPGGQAAPEDLDLLQFRVPTGGTLEFHQSTPWPTYRALDSSSPSDVFAAPGVVQVALPGDGLALWDNLPPTEAGVGDLPPALDDTNLNDRLITWLRVSPRADSATLRAAKVQVRLLWVGINAAMVTQRAHVGDELLPPGSGEPDQALTLANTPVIPESVQLTVTSGGKSELWKRIDDLTAAGPEVPAPDLRQPPGTPPPPAAPSKVFAVDAVSGQIRFGDGLRGARPPFAATMRAGYDYSVGAAGNIGPGSINGVPVLPLGKDVTLKVSNPVRTWGGVEAETVSAGEKQIARYLQHRDRLVTAADFETIARRTPGLDIGRVDVLPAFSPELSKNQPDDSGSAPGAVTLLVIPGYDPDHPDAPEPDRLFLNTICEYLDSRRLVTTEVFLRGPVYVPIRVSIGIEVVAGMSAATVREAVKSRISAYLSPLPASGGGLPESPSPVLTTPQYAAAQRGWPLRKPVVALELSAEANRVPGVRLVLGVQLAGESGGTKDQIEMFGLNLPRLVNLSVAAGDPVPMDRLGSDVLAEAPSGGTAFLSVPVPVVPEEC